MAKTTPKTKKGTTSDSAHKRVYLKQSDVPAAALDDALRVPQAILDHYAGKPTLPFHVAKALNVDPKGSQLKVLTGAAIAFGLIAGGAQAATITITDLSKRILRPKVEGEDFIARREAVLSPRIFREFLGTYDGHPFPRQDIALNVLEDMGVPRDKANEVLSRIDATARSVGFIEEIKDKPYVSLQGQTTSPTAPSPNLSHEDEAALVDLKVNPAPLQQITQLPIKASRTTSLATAIADDERRRKVFITHGKSRDFVEPIKKLLEYGELTPVVSVERQSVSKPVPEKVMDDMRFCGAAIIHVDADRTVIDKEGQEHVLLNPNVLIEIGAAMAFYGKRFILLVKDGVKMPSNLQGLYEVRYSNDALDASATIKLLEAIKDIKNHSLPTDTTVPDP